MSSFRTARSSGSLLCRACHRPVTAQSFKSSTWRALSTEGQQKVGMLDCKTSRESANRRTSYCQTALRKPILRYSTSSEKSVPTTTRYQILKEEKESSTDSSIGEAKAEAFRQPDPLRELHEPGCARCARECDAKWVSCERTRRGKMTESWRR